MRDATIFRRAAGGLRAAGGRRLTGGRGAAGFCLILCLGLAGRAAALDLSWDLETRAFISYAGPWDLGSGLAGGLSYGSVSANRIELSAASSGSSLRASARASFEASVLTGAAAAQAWALAGLPEGLAGSLPADQVLVPSYDSAATAPTAMLIARVRTAWVRLDPGWASLTAGRQILNYGPSPLWSPVDLFSGLEASGLDTVRRGVDALRLRLPMGEAGMADLVASPLSDPAAGSYALRFSGLAAGGLELGAVAARKGPSAGAEAAWVLGGDFKLDLGASFYGEATLAMPDTGGEPLFRAAAGADWSMGDIVIAGEYYWNGGVTPGLDPYGAGSHNVYLALSWKASDFLGLGSRLLWSSSQDSLTGTVYASLDAAQGATARAWASLGRSDSAQAPLQASLGAGLALSF